MSNELYIPSTNPEAMTEALWEFSRPLSVRKPGEITQGLFPAYQDAKGGKWLVVHPDCWINIHPEADCSRVEKLLLPLVENGTLSAETLSGLRKLVDANRGGRIQLYEDGFPPEIKAQGRTRLDMMDAGLWVNPLIPTP